MQLIKNKIRFFVGANFLLYVSAAFLAGCAGYKEMEKTVDDDVLQTTKRIEAARAQMPINKRSNSNSPYIKKSAKPFIAASSVPKSNSENLPPQFSRVTINLPGKFTLAQAAQIIIEATGIPVMLSEDINLPAGSGQPQQVKPMQPESSPAMARQETDITRQYPIVLGYANAPLSSILDEISAAAGGLSWDYNNGRISFYRFVTKTFTLTVPLYDPISAMTVGMNNQMQTGSASIASSAQTGSGNATFSATFTASMKAWDEAIGAIKDGILSPNGRVVASKTAQTVTITDGRRQVEQTEKFIEELNRVYGRQIAVHIEVISLTLTRQSEFGINWALVLNKINAINGNQIQFALSSPAGIVDPNAASAGVKIIKQVNGQLDWSTSQAMITALESVGVISQRRSLDTIAMNRRVTPIASLRNTAYLAQTTPATATAGGTGGVPGLTPGNISYGFSLSMIPSITSDNSVVLDFGLLQSDLIALVSKTSGSGINQQTLELPDIVAQQLVQTLKLNTGDTLVISGLEQDTHQYDKRTLNKDWSPAMGGTFSGNTGRQSLIVMITPIVD